MIQNHSTKHYKLAQLNILNSKNIAQEWYAARSRVLHLLQNCKTFLVIV